MSTPRDKALEEYIPISGSAPVYLVKVSKFWPVKYTEADLTFILANRVLGNE
jgi:hypothetical protein